jgi:hypothetical protein
LHLIGGRNPERDLRPLRLRLEELIELLRFENQVVLLGEGAQVVIHEARRELAGASVHSDSARRALKVFEGMELWECVRSPGPFGNEHPIDSRVAAGDVEMILSLLTAVDQAPQSQQGFRTTAIDSAVAQSSSFPSEIGGQNRRRTPDIQLSRERLSLLDKLVGELTTVFQQKDKATSVEALKRKYPNFELWKQLSQPEQVELLTEDFIPKAYAKTLVKRKYGLLSDETVKNDREKLRKFAAKG